MIIQETREKLSSLQDLKYRDMQVRIIPSVKPESIIGVRTPELRKMAKELAQSQEIGVFLENLPHKFFEENQLHAFIVSGMKDYRECLGALNRFLPYVDNWLGSAETYTIRFGIGMLMEHYLDEDYDPACPEMVAAVRSEEYYVNMMIAWYFATALAKQYEAVLPFITEHRLDTWTHNKAIQKAIESFRITPEQKEYLKSLKNRSR